MKLSIIMPAYNEEKRIGRTLKAYLDFFENLRKMKRIDYNLLVVINNTADKTEEIVQKFVKSNKRISYLSLKEGGKGNAVIQGFKHELKTGSDLIGFVDADMATSPEEFFKLVKFLDSYDSAIASRYLGGSKVIPPVTFRRVVVSRIFNSLIHAILFLPCSDTQCGAKIFKKRAIEEILPKLTFSKWAFDVDLIYSLRKQGFRIKEVPTVWIDREYSKINFIKSAPWMTLAIIRLRLINSPFKGVVKAYDKINNFIYKLSR